MKWIKVVQRNIYPLQWHKFLIESRKGNKHDPVFWQIKHGLVVKNQSASIMFYPERNTVSNITTSSQEDVDAFFDHHMKFIEEVLKLKPGKDKEHIRVCYETFGRVMAVMAMGHWIGKDFVALVKQEPGCPSDINLRLARPFKSTMVQQEHQAIIDADKDDVASLASRFGWLHSEYMAQEWGIEEYTAALQSVKKHVHEEDGKEDSWLVQCAQKSLYVLDQGKAAVVRASWAMRKTLEAMNLDEEAVMNCFEDEFFAWLDGGGLPQNKIRSEHYGILLRDDTYSTCEGKDAVEQLIADEQLTEYDPVAVDEVRGEPAFAGKVQGKARIVLSQADANALREGEILVTGNTTPELIGAMHRAAAFVTDEGGILCHAAIVAREMQKPCIIGTELATRAFKDGEMIEVDAEKGIVRKLK